MKIVPNAGIALALSGLFFLQPGCKAEQKGSAGQKPQETRDKVSYSIGVSFGNNLKRDDLDINPEFLAKGIKDVFSGKTVMTDDEMKATLQAFQKEMEGKMQAKQQALGEKNKAESDKFLAENKKKDGVVTTPSGLQYKIVKEGTGPKPKASDVVSVTYRGTLVNGTEFDKSKEPVSFQVQGVIPGWVEALQMMPVGSQWQLFIPPNLAYGESAPPAIGPNQTLIFDVELVGIKKAENEKAEAVTPPVTATPSESPAPSATPAK